MAIDPLAPLGGLLPQGAGTGASSSPDDIKRRRLLAMALMNKGTDASPVGHWTQALARVAQGALGAYDDKMLGEEERAGYRRAAEAVTGAYGPDAAPGQPTAPAATPAPMSSGGPDPRGIRTNNPGNIKDSEFARAQPGYKGSDGVNAVFESPDAGYGAMDKLLDTYGSKYGLNTVSGILGRWAPSDADNNDTSGYIGYVAKRLGIDPNAPLTPEARAKLPEAMAYFENGREFPRTPQPVRVASAGPMAYAPSGASLPGAPALPPGADPIPPRPPSGPSLPGAPAIPPQWLPGAQPQMAQGPSLPGAPAIRPPEPSLPGAPPASALQGGQQQMRAMKVLMDPNVAPWLNDTQRALLLQQAKPHEFGFQTTPDGTILRTDPRTGTVAPIYRGQPKDDRPGDIKEYEYAVRGGYVGNFPQYQREMKEAGRSSTSVNIDQKAQGELEKKLAGQVGEMFAGLYKEGVQANQDLYQIDRLKGLLAQSGSGLGPALTSVAAGFGIELGEGAGPGQAAKAIIARLIPSQRVAGSGTTSDKDLQLFQAALPSMMNTPEGNSLIIDTMQGLAEHKRALGDIAGMVTMQEISPKDAIAKIRELPNPFAQFKSAYEAAKPVSPSGAPAGAPPPSATPTVQVPASPTVVAPVQAPQPQRAPNYAPGGGPSDPDAGGWTTLPNGIRIRQIGQ